MKSHPSFKTIRSGHLGNLKRLKRRIAQLAVARVVLFVAFATAVYLTFGQGLWPAALAAVGLVIFLVLVRRHAEEKEERDHTQNAIAICDEELARENGGWRNMDGGELFGKPDHPYTADLGVFGKHSLYQYTNRSQSPAAACRWARMLGENLTSPEAILKEREYIQSLSEDMDFAVSYLARARRLRTEEAGLEAVRKWSEVTEGGATKFRDLWFTRILPAFSILITVAYGIGAISGTAYLWLLLIPAAAVFLHLKKHLRAFAEFENILGKLPAYSEMLSMLRTRAQSDSTAAARWGYADLEKSEDALKALKSIAGAMDARNNIFVSIVLNLLLLWDFQVYRRLRIWKEAYAENLPRWLELTADVEAYMSPAIFAHKHPHFVFPEFSEAFDFEIREAKHVLLDEDAVPNDLSMTGKTRFAIITGANMAGKSTYLRTMGTCLILAMRGLPVPAAGMVFKPTLLYTSMVTADSLGDGESYFFSELKRLKQLTDILEAGTPLFIVLDEILKGTNSVDKAVGSKKFLSKLLSLPAKGLIATHDLSLCEIEETYPDQVINRSFEVEFRGDELHFDYVLREGVCENMNAAHLLRKMGLTLEE